MQKTRVHTARCETISIEEAGSKSGQYRGKAPQRAYALTPKSKPVLFLLNYLKFVNWTAKSQPPSLIMAMVVCKSSRLFDVTRSSSP